MDHHEMTAENLLIAGIHKLVVDVVRDEISQHMSDYGLVSESDVEGMISDHLGDFVSASDFGDLLDAELANITLNRR